MGVPLGTTPTFTLTFNDEALDLTVARSVYVTFRSGARTLTKSGEDLEITEKQIVVSLSQAETLNMSKGNIKIQANWVSPDGKRAASNVVLYPLTEQLLKEVVD